MTAAFLWGTATSSHQVEGNNRFNDWWAWEQSGRLKFASGDACDSFAHFERDLEWIQKLGHTAYRFSIEWSRIEPRKGEFDREALETYRAMVESLRAAGVEPIVTLHHFTLPQWLAEEGGWFQDTSASYFQRFAETVLNALGPYVRYWITLNEPIVQLYHGYMIGVWPPGEKDFAKTMRAMRNMMVAHTQGYVTIHEFYRREGLGEVFVSLAKHMTYLEPYDPASWRDRFSVFLRNWFLNDLILKAAVSGFFFFPGLCCEFLPASGTLDFIGVNYYTRNRLQFAGWSSEGVFGREAPADADGSDGIERNSLGWEVCSRGLGEVFKRLSGYRLPIMVTENGICTDDDRQRIRFIQDHLAAVAEARAGGIPVTAYLYWSLLDNFEWDKGFAPHFGILEVEPDGFSRKVKASAHVLSDLCRKLSHGTYSLSGGSLSGAPGRAGGSARQ